MKVLSPQSLGDLRRDIIHNIIRIKITFKHDKRYYIVTIINN